MENKNSNVRGEILMMVYNKILENLNSSRKANITMFKKMTYEILINIISEYLIDLHADDSSRFEGILGRNRMRSKNRQIYIILCNFKELPKVAEYYFNSY